MLSSLENFGRLLNKGYTTDNMKYYWGIEGRVKDTIGNKSKEKEDIRI